MISEINDDLLRLLHEIITVHRVASIDKVVEAVSLEGYGQATVYNALDTLASKDMITFPKDGSFTYGDKTVDCLVTSTFDTLLPK